MTVSERHWVAGYRDGARAFVRRWSLLLSVVVIVPVGMACNEREPFLPNGGAGAGANSGHDAGDVSGAGGEGGGESDSVGPTVQILFPPRLSYSDATTIEVRGTAGDDQGVKAVTVNGVDAVSYDDFRTWRVRVPIGNGPTELQATATDSAGNRMEDTVVVTNDGPPIGDVMALTWDEVGRRLIIGSDAQAIVAFEPETGAVTMISDPRDGAEPVILHVSALALDSARDRALVVDSVSDALIALDLASGARTVVSESSDDFENGLREALAIDTAGRTAFVLAGFGGTNNLLRIDLETGERTLLSGESAGEGPVLDASSTDILYDDVTDPRAPRLLVMQSATGSIFAVDPETGDRSVFIEPDPTGADTGLTEPYSMTLDRAEERLLVLARPLENSQLFAVSLMTGAATPIVASSSPVDYPFLSLWYPLAYDGENQTVYTGIAGWHQAGDLLSIDLETLEQTPIGNATVGTGVALAGVNGAVLEPSEGPPSALLVSDSGRRALVRVALANGDRTQVSGPERGSGPMPFEPRDVTIEEGAERPTALVLDAGDEIQGIGSRLLRVDLESGDRSFVSSADRGEGPELLGAVELALDTRRGRTLVTCPFCEEQGVYAIDLDTGDRTLVSAVSRGSGPDPGYVMGMTLDTASDRALVVSQQQVLTIDLDSGDRTELVPADGFSSPYALDVLTDIAFDATLDRALVISVSSNAVLAIDMTDYSRSLVSGGTTFADSVGSGPALIFPTTIVPDLQSSVIYLGEASRAEILTVDLQTGERVIGSR